METTAKVYKSFANNYRLICEPNPKFNKVKITGTRDTVEYLTQLYEQEQNMDIVESFFILILNRANTVTGWVKISSGGITGTVADPRIIAKYAVENLACGIIMCHNHPSGNLQPSRQDEVATQNIKQGLAFLDIKLVDHVILSSEGFYSFLEEGML